MLSFRESTSLFTLAGDQNSALDTNVGILTLCQSCNILVNDIDRHIISGSCPNQPDESVANLTDESVSNQIIISLKGIGGATSSTNVLDDLGNNRMNQTGIAFLNICAFNLKINEVFFTIF